MLNNVNRCCWETVRGFDCNLKVNPCSCILFFFGVAQNSILDIGRAFHRISASDMLIIHLESNTILTQMPCKDGGGKEDNAPTAAVTAAKGDGTHLCVPSSPTGIIVTPTIPLKNNRIVAWTGPAASTASADPATSSTAEPAGATQEEAGVATTRSCHHHTSHKEDQETSTPVEEGLGYKGGIGNLN